MIENNLVKNLRHFRKLKNLTQEKLGEMADLSHRYYQQIESGGVWPSAKTIESLAKALKINPEILFREQSKERFMGEMSISDASEILSRLASTSIERRAIVLSILFGDPSLLKGLDLSPLKADLSHIIPKAK